MSVDREGGVSLSVEKPSLFCKKYVNNEKEMYCTWESIDTDNGPQTTDDNNDDGHTLNLYYYLNVTWQNMMKKMKQLESGTVNYSE